MMNPSYTDLQNRPETGFLFHLVLNWLFSSVLPSAALKKVEFWTISACLTICAFVALRRVVVKRRAEEELLELLKSQLRQREKEEEDVHRRASGIVICKADCFLQEFFTASQRVKIAAFRWDERNHHNPSIHFGRAASFVECAVHLPNRAECETQTVPI